VQGLDLLVTIARVRRDASALERILADGTRMGCPAITLHARLGLAEVDAAAGRATAARARLASLERDAGRRRLEALRPLGAQGGDPALNRATGHDT
jgi:hypothetical protein